MVITLQKIAGWRSLGCAILFMLASCTGVLERTGVPADGQQVVTVEAKASCEERKTALNGLNLSWTSGDRIGMYVSGIISNTQLLSKGGDDFIGYLPQKGGDGQEHPLYTYYPYCMQEESQTETTVVRSALPLTQKAPFDSRADFMVGDVSSISYTPDNVPQVNLQFANHLFSILRIEIVNSKPELSLETLGGIQIESKSRRLSGSFTFDVSKGAEANAVFPEEEGETDRRVEMTYSSPAALGTGTKHTLNVVIPAGLYPSGDLTVTVFVGNDMIGSVESKCDMTFTAGSVHEIQTIDVGTMDLSRRYKTVICFGDSITTGTVEDCLQSLLGMKWKVYPAGISGERIIQIMARSGAIPLYLKGPFTIPSGQGNSVMVGTTFYTNLQTDGIVLEKPTIPISFSLSSYSGKNAYCGLTNPFMVNGVECTISSADGKLILTRLTDGDKVECGEDDVLALPYSKWKLGNPTVTTAHMGTNGAYTGRTDRSANQVLTDMYKMMQDGTTGKFIAIGYQHSKWSESYRDTFREAFGDNYLDLRTYGCQHAEEIARQEGYGLTDIDFENISNNIWPSTWGGLETHPYEPVGARAHAYCIYYKMKELGYLDE